jgi:metal-responsive CopG/Arc/MetJ family transcriptional regulator
MRPRTIRKTVIALLAELLAEVDRAARALGVSRGRYITRILRCAVRARRHAEITRRLDELFASPALAEEQRRTAAQLDAVGSSWDAERW